VTGTNVSAMAGIAVALIGVGVGLRYAARRWRAGRPQHVHSGHSGSIQAPIRPDTQWGTPGYRLFGQAFLLNGLLVVF